MFKLSGAFRTCLDFFPGFPRGNVPSFECSGRLSFHENIPNCIQQRHMISWYSDAWSFAVGALKGPWLKIQALFCWNISESSVQAPVTHEDTASFF